MLKVAITGESCLLLVFFIKQKKKELHRSHFSGEMEQP